jgi:hypothetical protein
MPELANREVKQQERGLYEIENPGLIKIKSGYRSAMKQGDQ